MKRENAALLLWALLTVAGSALSGCGPGETSATMQAPPKPVRTVVAAPEPLREAARYAAVIRPRTEADLGFRVAGKVTARPAEVGRRVAAGDVLATLDPTDLELQVRAARAQLAAAKADADNARAEYARYQKLKQGEWTTTQERDRRKTLLDKADAHVREVGAALDVLVNSLQYATLRADGAGVVTATLVEPGQVLAAGQTAIRVARDGQMEAVADIPENRLAGLERRRLTVSLWSQPGTEIRGALREIAPAADPDVRTFQTRITLIDPPPGVMLGMTATVTVHDDDGAPAVRLPASALIRDGDKPAVWVVGADDNRLTLRPVTVTAYTGDEVLISAGLARGERVVTAGAHKLTAWEQVRLWSGAAR